MKITNTRLLQNSNLKQKVKKMTIQKFGKTLFIYSCALIAVACSKKDDPQPAKTISAAFEKENKTVTTIPDGLTDDLANPLKNGMKEIPITIDQEGIIKDASKVSVEVDLSHSYASDIVVELFDPSGDSCGLIKRLGTTNNAQNGDNFITGNKLNFCSLFTIPVPQLGGDSDIPAGDYKPTFGVITNPINVTEKALGSFFNNKSIKGIWKIRVYDCSKSDVGTLNSWKIKFAEGAL